MISKLLFGPLPAKISLISRLFSIFIILFLCGNQAAAKANCDKWFSQQFSQYKIRVLQVNAIQALLTNNTGEHAVLQSDLAYVKKDCIDIVIRYNFESMNFSTMNFNKCGLPKMLLTTFCIDGIITHY